MKACVHTRTIGSIVRNMARHRHQWVPIETIRSNDRIIGAAADGATLVWRVQSVAPHPARHWEILLLGEAGSGHYVVGNLGTWVKREMTPILGE